MATDGRASAREPFIPQDSAAPGGAPADHGGSPPPASFVGLFRCATPGDRLVLAVAVLGAITMGVTGPALSFFMKDLFQSIYLPNDDGTLPPADGPHQNRDEKVVENLQKFLVLAAVAFSSAACGYLGFARTADRMTLELRQRFFNHLLMKDVGWYDLNSAAEMSTRLTSDTYDFRQGTGEKLAQLVSGVVMSPAGFVVAFTHDWRLTLIMLVAIPFLTVSFAYAMNTMSKAAASQQGFYAKAGGVAETALSSIRTVSAFGGQEREIAKYDEQLAQAQRDGTRAGWCNGFSLGFSQLMMYSMFALGFYAGSFLVLNDYNDGCWRSLPPFGTCFTGATMISTLFAVMYGGAGLATLAPSLAALTTAKAAAGRIYAVIDDPPAFDAEAGERPDRVCGTVEFRDVRFSYPSRPDSVALDQASFVVPAGTTAAFVGASGSGKSTAINLVQRFYDPGSGTVLVDGLDIRGLSLSWLRSKMALVQQEPVLFSGSVFDNIGYGREGCSQQDVEKAARAANAHDFICGFPRRYQTEVGERGTQMSGGQKQRIAIARAMVRDPAILLLDEATSALDTESERIVQKALDDLLKAKARTTFIVAHRLSTIRDADVIFVMEGGRVVEQGRHSELMADAGSLYSSLVQLQQTVGDGSSVQLLRQVSAQISEEKHPERAQPDLTRDRSAEKAFRAIQMQRRRSSGATNDEVAAAVEEAQASLSREVSHEAAPDAPPEDDEEIPVPLRRLWALQRPELLFVALALSCTVPAGAGRPLIGTLFSTSSNLFSKPPATIDMAHIFPPCRDGDVLADGICWTGGLDTANMREEADKSCLEFVSLGFIMLFSTMCQLGSFRTTAEALTRRLRLLTFKAMLRQEMAWFDARTTGTLADRLATEAPLIKSFTGESLAAMIQVFCTVGTGLFMALRASWRLTLFNMLFLPFMAAGSAVMMRGWRKVNETKAGPVVSEAMGNIRAITSFGLQRQMMQRYLKLLREEGAQERRKSTSTSMASAYQSGISFVMFGVVIYVANFFVSKGWTLPQDVLQVLFPIMFAASGTAVAVQWAADKARGRTAVNHIFRTLDRQPVIDTYSEEGRRLPQVRGEVEFRNVAFTYPTRPGVAIFTDLNLTIAADTTVAFCGPSGSGKSTTVALLQRFYDPNSGLVLLDGNDLRELNIGWLRRQMALVQQEPVLFSGTILENIRYGREDASEKDCTDAAKAANAHGFVSEFPDGYDTQVGDRGGQLSGGQKQRIAIARCMVRDPRILLLDEATSALDNESERIVQEALDVLLAQSRRTTLVIAHRLSTIRKADTICVIYQGTIVEKGTHTELMQIPDGHYKKLAARQDDGDA